MDQRLRYLFLFFLIGFLAVIIKLFYWQIIENKRLSDLAIKQYYTSKEIPAERGKIYTQDNFPLVMNKENHLLYANPQELKIPPEQLVTILKTILPELKPPSQLSDRKLMWVPLVKNLDSSTKKSIEDLKIAGLGFESMDKRYYPEASMAAHLLGFVGEDSEGKEKGYFGLEGYYDNELKGKAGIKYYEKDALGRPIPLSEQLEEKPIEGRNLFLNLDREVQFAIEYRLKKGLEKYGASSGLVIVMNPKNGAILGMASFPSYDPEKYYLFDQELYRNPAISFDFEPGSIFKVLVMAAGIDSGRIKPDEVCGRCEGPRKIGEYTIKTWNDKYFPGSTMTDILVHSDNVGMVYVVEKLGKERFYDYLDRFGFGRKTGIDLQGEISPKLRDKEDWREIDLATASFGQGIAATPIQILAAVSAIANGGNLYQPQVVKSIVEEKKTITLKPVKVGKPISETTVKIITQMMVEAVEKGEAKWAKPKGYVIAGKTGTAQIPIAGHYDPEKTIASFIGFAPANDPKFAMLVTLREPKTSPWGSETAAPLWFEIAKDIFRLWKIKAG